VIEICFWGPARRSGSPPSREAAGAAGDVPFSLPGRWAGASDAPETEIKCELGSPRCRGAHNRAEQRRASAPTVQTGPHYEAMATRCRDHGNGYPAGGLWVVAGHKARWRRIFPVCRARHRLVDECDDESRPHSALDGQTPDTAYFGVPPQREAAQRAPSRGSFTAPGLLSNLVGPPLRSSPDHPGARGASGAM
jgi:hypothetical protein